MATTAKSVRIKILVIGSGIAGLSAAIALSLKDAHQHRYQITILERSPTLQGIGGSLLIPPQACKVLDSFGVYEKFLKADLVRDGLIIYRYQDGSQIMKSDFGWLRRTYGYPTLNIQRREYQSILYERAVELGVAVKFDCRVEIVNEGALSVQLTNGEVFETDLIIGADGTGSKVRTAILGDGEDTKPRLGDSCYLCRASASEIRADPLTSPLMENPDPVGWLAPGRHVVGSSARFGEFFSFVLIFDYEWPHKPEIPLSANWYTLGDIDFMKEAFKDCEPRLRRILEFVKPEDCRLWRISTLPDLSSWVGESGRSVIIGDAAHAMCPYLAQGAASATEDGASLAECMARAETLDQIPKALKAFETIRKPRVHKLKAASEYSGVEKHYSDGEKQRKRDDAMQASMKVQQNQLDTSGQNTHPSAWVHGYDVTGHANAELDKIYSEEGDVSTDVLENYEVRAGLVAG